MLIASSMKEYDKTFESSLAMVLRANNPYWQRVIKVVVAWLRDVAIMADRVLADLLY